MRRCQQFDLGSVPGKVSAAHAVMCKRVLGGVEDAIARRGAGFENSGRRQMFEVAMQNYER